MSSDINIHDTRHTRYYGIKSEYRRDYSSTPIRGNIFTILTKYLEINFKIFIIATPILISIVTHGNDTRIVKPDLTRKFRITISYPAIVSHTMTGKPPFTLKLRVLN